MTALYGYGLAAADFPLSTLGSLTGIGGAPILALTAGDTLALVSPLAPPIAATPMTRTRRNLLTHTHVLETCHRAGTVLPFRFGTVAPDRAALIGCITRHRADFADAMRAIIDRVELGVRAQFRDGVMFARLAASDPSLRDFRDRLRSRPEAERYYGRIELGRRVEAAIGTLRRTETARLTAEIAAIAERLAVLPAQDDAVIFNHAYLVPRSREADFDAAMERLAARAGEEVELRYVGPMPPFNFVALQAGWLTADAAAA